jgi:hypothetical protein
MLILFARYVQISARHVLKNVKSMIGTIAGHVLKPVIIVLKNV